MSKLYESRSSNLINPLTKDEVGYVFDCNTINCIIKQIDGNKYGSYLIGGVVGTGKSSMIDIATSYTHNTSLVIHINFYDENECIDKFSRIVMENLIEALEKKIDKDDKNYQYIRKCKQELCYNIEESFKNSQIDKSGTNNSKSKKLSILSKVGGAFNGLVSAEANIEKNENREDISYKDSDKIREKVFSLTKIENNRLDDILNLISIFEEQNIVIVYDEIDKMDNNILSNLFKKYKSLFVEKKIYNFFLVNDKMYRIYSNNNITKNSLYTYFSGKYYVPLLDLQDTIRYCIMMFGERDYLKCMSLYYISLGNYRILNAQYSPKASILQINVIKSYILIRVLKKIDVPYLEKSLKDMIIQKIKIVIEEVITQRHFTKEKLIEFLRDNDSEDYVWPTYKEILELVIDIITLILPECIEVEENNITVNGNILHLRYNIIKSEALQDRNEIFSDNEVSYVQMSDMNSVMKKGISINKNMNYLRKNTIPIEVAVNDPESYDDALVNIMKSNLCENDMQVLVLKRERGQESYEKNDHEYTGVIVIDKGIFDVAYYVDRGSYDSDKYSAVENLMKEAKAIGVNVAQIEIKSYINVRENINYIVEQYNKR